MLGLAGFILLCFFGVRSVEQAQVVGVLSKMAFDKTFEEASLIEIGTNTLTELIDLE